jgi:hypothetical protein
MSTLSTPFQPGAASTPLEHPLGQAGFIIPPPPGKYKTVIKEYPISQLNMPPEQLELITRAEEALHGVPEPYAPLSVDLIMDEDRIILSEWDADDNDDEDLTWNDLRKAFEDEVGLNIKDYSAWDSAINSTVLHRAKYVYYLLDADPEMTLKERETRVFENNLALKTDLRDWYMNPLRLKTVDGVNGAAEYLHAEAISRLADRFRSYVASIENDEAHFFSQPSTSNTMPPFHCKLAGEASKVKHSSNLPNAWNTLVRLQKKDGWTYDEFIGLVNEYIVPNFPFVSNVLQNASPSSIARRLDVSYGRTMRCRWLRRLKDFSRNKDDSIVSAWTLAYSWVKKLARGWPRGLRRLYRERTKTELLASFTAPDLRPVLLKQLKERKHIGLPSDYAGLLTQARDWERKHQWSPSSPMSLNQAGVALIEEAVEKPPKPKEEPPIDPRVEKRLRLQEKFAKELTFRQDSITSQAAEKAAHVAKAVIRNAYAREREGKAAESEIARVKKAAATTAKINKSRKTQPKALPPEVPAAVLSSQQGELIPIQVLPSRGLKPKSPAQTQATFDPNLPESSCSYGWAKEEFGKSFSKEQQLKNVKKKTMIITFKDVHGKDIPVKHTLRLTDQHVPVTLGSDVITESKENNQNKGRLALSRNLNYMPQMLSIRGSEKCLQLQVTGNVTIPAMEQVSIELEPSDTMTMATWTGQKASLKAAQSLKEGLVVFRSWLTVKGCTRIPVPVFNDSNKPVHLSKGEAIASISTLPRANCTAIRVSSAKQAEDLWRPSKRSQVKCLHRRLQRLQYDVEERNALAHRFMETGSIRLSPGTDNSTEIEQLNANPEDLIKRTPEEIVQSFDMDHLSEPVHLETELRAALDECKKVFRTGPQHHSTTGLLAASCPIKETLQPHIQKPRTFHPQVKEEIQRTLDRLLACGIIERAEATPTFLNSLLYARSPDGRLNICLDTRYLNTITEMLTTPEIDAIRIQDIFTKATFCSTIAANDIHKAIPLDKNAKEKLSFKAYGDFYHMATVPAGWKLTRYYTSCLLKIILKGIEDADLVGDEIVIASASWGDHVQAIKDTLNSLIGAGVLITPSKCCWATPELMFQGVIYKHGKTKTMSLAEESIAELKNLKKPSTVKELKAMMNSYAAVRNNIPRYAEIARHLYDATASPGTKLTWTPDMEKSLKDLEQALLQHSTLQCPDSTKPFYVYSDASIHAAASIIMQKDDEGKLKIVTALSRTFRDSDMHLHIVQKELLAVCMAQTYLSHFLGQAVVHYFVDASAILYTINAPRTNYDIARRANALTMTDFTLSHVQGVHHVMPDYASRAHADAASKPARKDERPISAKAVGGLFAAIGPTRDINLSAAQVADWLTLTQPLPNPSKAKKARTKSKAKPITHTGASIAPRPKTIRTPKLHPNMYSQRGMRSQKEDLKSQAYMHKYKQRTDRKMAKYRQHKQHLQDLVDSAKAGKNWSESDKQLVEWTNKSHKNSHKGVPPPTDDLVQPAAAIARPARTRQQTKRMLEQLQKDKPELLEQMKQNGALPEQQYQVASQWLGRASDDGSTKAQAGTSVASDEATAIAERLMTTVPTKGPIPREAFRHLQELDPDINAKTQPEEGGKDTKTHPYREINGVICYQRRWDRQPKPVLPTNLAETMARRLHFTALACHATANKITCTLRQVYHHPDLKNVVTNVVNDCRACAIALKPKATDRRMGVSKAPDGPRQSYAMDLISGLPPAATGHRLIICIVDRFSGLARFYPAKAKTAPELTRALQLVAISDATHIKHLVTDGESAINAPAFKKFMALHGTVHHVVTPGNANSNNIAEHALRSARRMIRSMTAATSSHWTDYIHTLTPAMARMTTKLGYTNEEAHFGCKSRTFITPPADKPALPSIAERRKLLLAIREKKIKEELKRMEKGKDKLDHRKLFKPGDRVMCRANPIGQYRTTLPQMTGPYIILRSNPDSYTCHIRHLTSGRTKKRRRDHLQHCKAKIPTTTTMVPKG